MEGVPMVKEQVLRELIEASLTTISATVAGQERGFALIMRLGNSDKTLATTRGAIRLFASLDTASAFVRDLGIERFEVDMTNHHPGRLRCARPDRAQALRLTRTRMQQQTLELGT
jgi:hypothetical protein